jgi:hypothetical protein
MRKVVFAVLTVALALVSAPAAPAWVWPVEGPVLTPFVLGDDPYAGGQHRGIDIGAAAEAAVRAPAAGEVTFAGAVPRYGKTVTIRTPDGFAVTLLHLGALAVSRGASVEEGQTVARATAGGDAEHAEPYVYLGIRRWADEHGYMDPLGFLPARPAAPMPPVTTSAPPLPTPAPPVATPAPTTPPVSAGVAAPAAPDPPAPGAEGRVDTAPTEPVVEVRSPAEDESGAGVPRERSARPRARPATRPRAAGGVKAGARRAVRDAGTPLVAPQVSAAPIPAGARQASTAPAVAVSRPRGVGHGQRPAATTRPLARPLGRSAPRDVPRVPVTASRHEDRGAGNRGPLWLLGLMAATIAVAVGAAVARRRRPSASQLAAPPARLGGPCPWNRRAPAVRACRVRSANAPAACRGQALRVSVRAGPRPVRRGPRITAVS